MTSIADKRAALLLHNEGIALARARDLQGAAARLLEAVRLLGSGQVDPRTLKALWQLAIEAGDWRVGVAAGICGAVRDPLDAPFSQSVLESLVRCPPEALVSGEPPEFALPDPLPSLSVIVVSQDDTRYAAVDAEYARAFAEWPHQRIRVKGAASMYDGYRRGFEKADGEIVVFSHDDIRFAVPDFAARLVSALRDADVVGVAGTTSLSGPAMTWAGQPHLFGAVAQQGTGEPDFEFTISSLTGPRVGGAQGLDGVFIATRRAVVERVGFDPIGFPGFHFYDLDFSYRAFLAGARLTIAVDLGIIHQSRGNFDDQWMAAQRRFARKFRFAGEPPAVARHHYSVRLPDESALGKMYAKLFAAWRLGLG